MPRLGQLLEDPPHGCRRLVRDGPADHQHVRPRRLTRRQRAAAFRGVQYLALVVAVLVFASSMLTAGALARRDRERVSGRREFLGLAASCAGSGLFGGFPANASESRSFVVADTGARSQMATLRSAVTACPSSSKAMTTTAAP